MELKRGSVGMKLMAKVIKIFDFFNGIFLIIAGIFIVFLVLSVSLEVVLRYFFNSPTIWVVEIAEYILVYIPFLAGAWVLKRGGHVRMDLVLNRLSPKNQYLVNAITSFVGAVICFILTWSGVKATLYYVGYKNPTPLMMPKSLIIAVIFVGMFLLFVQFLRLTYGFLASWRAPADKKEGPVKKPEHVF
jgi:C4-dicarboxylate transporter DctQ subunit